MKIVVVEPYARTPGHFERLSVRTCEAFTELGNNVTLATYLGISPESSRRTHAFKVLKADRNGTEQFDWRYHKGRIRLNSFRTFFRRQLWEYRTFRLAASIVDPDEVTIVHFYDADPILLTLMMASVLKAWRKDAKPVLVLTIHELTRLVPARSFKRRMYYWAYRRCLGKAINRQVDGIAVLDSSLKQGLVAHFGLSEDVASRIRVLPHGVGDPVEICDRDAARKRLKLNLNQATFLVFGILRNDKRIDLTLEALKGLQNCRLAIAGEPHGLTESAIKDLVYRAGCEQWVSTEINYISEKRMHDYFSACDAVIIPYDRTFKGLSGILTLACGHGRITIASDVGILGQTIRKHELGFAIEPDSAAAIREAVLRFLALTPEERAHMEERVRAYAAGMSWDAACKEWVEFYRELLARRNASSQS